MCLSEKHAQTNDKQVRLATSHESAVLLRPSASVFAEPQHVFCRQKKEEVEQKHGIKLELEVSEPAKPYCQMSQPTSHTSKRHKAALCMLPELDTPLQASTLQCAIL